MPSVLTLAWGDDDDNDHDDDILLVEAGSHTVARAGF